MRLIGGDGLRCINFSAKSGLEQDKNGCCTEQLCVKGREPHGIVEPANYDQVIQKVIAGLYNYQHPETAKRIVSFCMTREEMELIGMGGEHVGDILYPINQWVNVCYTGAFGAVLW